MRIIAGLAKGRKLLSPESMVTRPTLDRVKESMFNILQNKTYGSNVLDAFAGTGSLGLEAASRGASHCYLIDKSPETYPLLKQNIINLKFDDICSSFNDDTYEVIKRLGENKEVFDIIFIDPPYAKDMIPLAVDLVDKYNMLASNGVIVTKIDSKEIIYEGSKNIVLYDKRKYGNTTICFYKGKED